MNKNKAKQINKRVLSLITPVNILLCFILIVLFIGFYTSSFKFKNFIDNIGVSYTSESIGKADFKCTTTESVQDGYYPGLVNQYQQQIPRFTYKDIVTYESIKVIKGSQYKFFFKQGEDSYFYDTEPTYNCECVGGIDSKTNLCQTK